MGRPYNSVYNATNHTVDPEDPSGLPRSHLPSDDCPLPEAITESSTEYTQVTCPYDERHHYD